MNIYLRDTIITSSDNFIAVFKVKIISRAKQISTTISKMYKGDIMGTSSNAITHGITMKI